MKTLEFAFEINWPLVLQLYDKQKTLSYIENNYQIWLTFIYFSVL